MKNIIIMLMLALVISGCSQDDRNSVSENEKPVGFMEVKAMKEIKSGKWSPELSDAEQETLFAIAEDTLDWCVNGGNGEFKYDEYEITPKMKVETATFVTLKIEGMLRGCIGSLAPVAPLYVSVHHNAVNAAMKDHRFPVVKPDELPLLEVHISILSPIEYIDSVDDFKIGEHGIIIERDYNRAVYLPEVAVEQGWNKEETLSSLSMKAGLNADVWKQGCKFQVFSSVAIEK